MGDDEEQGQGAGREPAGLRLVRDPDGRGGWARWRVLDGDDLVGFVAEDHEWLGDDFGPATYLAVHNPTGGALGGLWSAEGLETPDAALDALARRLSGHDDLTGEPGDGGADGR